MKQYRYFALLFALFTVLAAGCAKRPPSSEPPDSGSAKTLSVVATLFPQYDFARVIAGDRAEVLMLLPNGVDSHSFDPTPADLVRISNCDLFLYTGEEMEPWSHTIVESLNSERVMIADLSAGIPLDQEEHGHDGADNGHRHLHDPHIWTDPIRAKQMAESVCAALSAADPDGAPFYRANADAYLKELDALDKEFREIVQNGKRAEIIFAGRFAFHYFCERYGLSYEAAFDSCSSDTEPSVRTMAELIRQIGAQEIPVIFYEELTDPKVARSISEETGARPLLFHSCHNISKDEAAEGATYLSLMRQNAEHLREALN